MRQRDSMTCIDYSRTLTPPHLPMSQLCAYGTKWWDLKPRIDFNLYFRVEVERLPVSRWLCTGKYCLTTWPGPWNAWGKFCPSALVDTELLVVVGNIMALIKGLKFLDWGIEPVGRRKDISKGFTRWVVFSTSLIFEWRWQGEIWRPQSRSCV